MLESFVHHTKLLRPEVSDQFVVRTRFEKQFNYFQDYNIATVIAGAGLGKSSAVSKYLSSSKSKVAWISLSAEENQYDQFIRLLVHAIQGVLPNFGHELLELLRSPELLPPEEMGILFQNYLLKKEDALIVAIDDYHFINNMKNHRFLNSFLQQNIPNFQLILISRFDPPLNTSDWKLKNRLLEVRSESLQFDRKEISALYKLYYGNNPQPKVLRLLNRVSEGWTLVLKMIMQTMPTENELELFLSDFDPNESSLVGGLMRNILNQQSSENKACMEKLSIVDEFNSDVFKIICLKDYPSIDTEKRFNDFMTEISIANAIILPINNRLKWYRYHHFILGMLRSELFKKHSPAEIRMTYTALADWHAQENETIKAIKFYLKAEEQDLALDLFRRLSETLIQRSEFRTLEEAFNLFDNELVKESYSLRTAQVWLMIYDGNLKELAPVLKNLLQDLQGIEPIPEHRRMAGEVHAIMSYVSFHWFNNMDLTIDHSSDAIDLLDENNPSALGMAWIFYAAAMVANRKQIGIKQTLNKLSRTDNDILKGHLLIAVFFASRFQNDMDSAANYAKRILDLGLGLSSKFLIAAGHTYLGDILYHQGKDEESLKHLKSANELKHYNYQRISTPSALQLAHLLRSKDDNDMADRLIDETHNLALNNGDSTMLDIIDSSKAFLSIGTSQLEYAMVWALGRDFEKILPDVSTHYPSIFQAMVLTRSNNSKSLRRSLEIVEHSKSFFESRNDHLHLTYIQVIKSVSTFKLGKLSKAHEHMLKALDLAKSGFVLRPFLIFTEESLAIIKENQGDPIDPFTDIVLEILDRKRSNRSIRDLSSREKEVLSLSQTMTNKEVGNKLFISEKTVKVHITNINKKLKSANKFEAMKNARELGVL